MSAIIEKAILRARDAFGRNVTRSVDFRIDQLKKLRKCIDENYEEFVGALKADFRKPRMESVITEIEYVKNDIQYQLDHIHEYVKPQHVQKGLANFFDDAYVHYDPYGVVLIFSAWNYPVQVLLCPLVGAIAAGNCALIKPSEVASNTEKLFAKLLPQYLDQDCYHVITGGPEEATRMLQERFDLVFFTGSPVVGKIVYNAAAKFMTPVILELGGKSPVYIDESVGSQMTVAVKRILWGKLVNAGQTCIAPDYVLCSPDVQDKFIKAAKEVIADFYKTDPKLSESFARIINVKNFDRINSLLSKTTGKVVIGGETDRDECYVAPTVVAGVSSSDSLMREEIFGPILPIVTVDSADEAIAYVNRGEKPLTMYIFSNKKDVVDRFLARTSSGSTCINDTLMQACVHALPFGGVGNSGIGSYHGQFSFAAFSHSKAVLAKDYNPVLEFLAAARYPPYTESNTNRLKLLIAKSPLDNLNMRKTLSYAFTFGLGLATMLAGVFIYNKYV